MALLVGWSLGDGYNKFSCDGGRFLINSPTGSNLWLSVLYSICRVFSKSDSFRRLLTVDFLSRAHSENALAAGNAEQFLLGFGTVCQSS
jgi:hypothetical protein